MPFPLHFYRLRLQSGFRVPVAYASFPGVTDPGASQQIRLVTIFAISPDTALSDLVLPLYDFPEDVTSAL